MTFLEAIGEAKALAASTSVYVQMPHDQLFSAAFVYVMRTEVVRQGEKTLFGQFDTDVSQVVRPLKGTVHTAAAIFKIMSGSSEATPSEARRTGAALKRLGYKSVRHGGKILWIL